MGIKEFNQKCRESVFSYEAKWRNMTERMAYEVDLDNPYITLDNNYIESVWWILDKFNKEGYLYEGHKIVPYCPRCGTGLASHEVAHGYKEDKNKLNPYYKDITERLQGYFGTKVNISNKNNKGKIEIEYYSYEDLQRILDIIKL